MLSLCELRRVVRVLEADFLGARVERFVQSDPQTLAIALYVPKTESTPAAKRILGLSVDRELARIGELLSLPAAPQNPPAFVSYLRSHLSRARLIGVGLLDADRQLRLEFEAREGRFILLLTLFGHRSNLYVLDGAGGVKIALRPLADTRPELVPGAPYSSPTGGSPREGEDRFADVSERDFLRTITESYADQEAEKGASNLERNLRHVLKRELKNARRRWDKVRGELAEADQASVLQKHGELLKGALSRVEPGASEIVIDDYETGDPVLIPLDPKRSAKANLEATFKRYQKLLRRLTKAGGQADEAEAWFGQVEGWQASLDLVLTGPVEARPAALEELAGTEALAKLLGRSAARGARSRSEAERAPKLPARFRDLPRKLHPKRYLSADGLEIWVGRNDAGNDYLSTRLARGKDLFFHLDGAPGSHVILRTEGNDNPPDESILDASELAIHFSKQKRAGSADVHVVPIKQVKKPKGAKPGLVWVTGGRSIHLRREEKRLERVLASRIEE